MHDNRIIMEIRLKPWNGLVLNSRQKSKTNAHEYGQQNANCVN